jgi:hypothetical protein
MLISTKNHGLALALALGLGAASCSDDSTSDGGKTDRGTGKPEASVPLEASVKAEGGKVEAGKADSAEPDSGSSTDLFITEAGKAVCDSSCTNPFECVKSSSGGCVECTSTLHCTSNPWSLGPTCDTSTNYCICSSDADCTGNAYGKKCDTLYQLCSCESDSDCTESTLGTKCDRTYKYCYCSSDSDCSSSNLGKKCHSTYSNCYCTSTTDCPSGKTCTGKYGKISICE